MPTPAQIEFEHDVFLSYSRADEAIVRRVHEALEAVGFSVWRDASGILAGDDFITQIENGIQTSRVVVIFCSAAASVSHWAGKERHLADVLQTRIIPVRLDDSDVPLLQRPNNFVDLRNFERFDEAVQALRNALSVVVAPRFPGTDVPSASGAIEASPIGLKPELAKLQRLIDKQEEAARSLDSHRNLATLGGALFVLVLAGAAATSRVPTWAISSGCAGTLLTALAALSFRAQSRSRQATCEVYSAIRDGIEVYCPRQHSSCLRFRQRYERLLLNVAESGERTRGR